VATHGVFELDGGSSKVDNNPEVVVFDAAHDAGPIIDSIE
jgi:hypothetical protein